MRQSQLFAKSRREAPSDEVAKNAQLLIRAGYIHKELAGVYDLLPLGLRVVERINQIIRQAMTALGAEELYLSALQDPTLWQQTNRWDDGQVDIWFKTKLKSQTELGLGFTHEEPLTMLMKEHLQSYRDLPRAVYQFQTKFRNEPRAKSGMLRGREFLMKDLYSFHATAADQAAFYERVKAAYQQIFEQVGIGERTYLTFASGGAFSQFSHEFQTICEAGEDTIYLDADKRVAVNSEVAEPKVLAGLGLTKEELVPHKAIEVGNIFNLGTRFSEALGLVYLDEAGQTQPVWMGSYGLGPTRLMGTMVEVLADDHGLVWPKAVAPFVLHLIYLPSKATAVKTTADALYQQLIAGGADVLYDDRDLKAGEKFAESDLLGMPYRVVVSEKTLAAGQFELKDRASGESKLVSVKALEQLAVR